MVFTVDKEGITLESYKGVKIERKEVGGQEQVLSRVELLYEKNERRLLWVGS